jgi:hypothetical protein
MVREYDSQQISTIIKEYKRLNEFIDNLLNGVLPQCNDIADLILAVKTVTDEYEDLSQDTINKNIADALGKLLDNVRRYGV